MFKVQPVQVSVTIIRPDNIINDSIMIITQAILLKIMITIVAIKG